jgi:predicted ester cyclase
MTTEAQTQSDLMKRVSHRVLDEALTGRNIDIFDETHSPDVVWHGPGGRELHGLAELKDMVSGYLEAFPDLRMTVEHEVAEGNLLATEWRAVGTHDGPLGDIPPTGKKIDFRGHVIARFERGKIVEEFEVFDELAMLQQIGVVDAEDLPA